MEEIRRNWNIRFFTTLILFIGFLGLVLLTIIAINEVADFIDIFVIIVMSLMTILMGYISMFSMKGIRESGNGLVLWHSINDIVDVVLLSFIIGYIVQKGIPIVALIVTALGAFTWKYFFYSNIFPIIEINTTEIDETEIKSS